MSFTDQDKHALSDIVTGFTLAIVGVCRALEQQKQLMPGTIAEAIHTEMGKLPVGSSGQTVTATDILTNVSKGLKGEQLAKIRIP
jgi:hypothetical protein